MAGLKKAELSLLLTTDKKIHSINKEWREKDKPTDVLSFPVYDRAQLLALTPKFFNSEIPFELGDIVISVDTAKRQASEKKITLHRELEVLLVHGLLHLLGYDHEISPAEERRMKRLEKKLLTR